MKKSMTEAERNPGPTVKVVWRKKVIKHNFHAALKQRRLNAGLSLRKVAVRAGMDISALFKLESGRTEPSWGTVLRLAHALQTTPDAFVIVGDLTSWL